ncbi:DUF4139 domain-containing protein [Amycolatopsis suaedae]|uniref:Mucoidy inhibitor MuiA family protein n=1 Tax=Amycolatopsis suaedae TaxID=2510978 RepID=A0A4Q7IZQ7_9PSEU|nr:DUF4139 domain-containing protein [Amycolatopsis suaedae]RZQ59918.1 mucoidy inhibitor MuiA family protein [Amycolatopsis suaedae]
MPTTVTAPITAVTVYPSGARVTRRGRARLGADNRFVLAGLPLGLLPDSVRATGSGPATVLGVDVRPDVRARPSGSGLADLLDQQRAVRARIDELADAQAVADSRARLLESLGGRAGSALAKALATGTAEPGRVAEVNRDLGDQLGRVLAERRELADASARLAEELAAVSRQVDQLQTGSAPDRTGVVIELEPHEGAGDAEVELEVSYVVTEAHWTPGYDLRLRGDTMTVTWYGMVTQHTGEDWPAAGLALSTARPATTLSVPELTPWFLDHQPQAAPLAAYGGGAQEMATAAVAAPMRQRTAEVEQGTTAATYRPGRAVAVPSDGTAHRTTLAVTEAPAQLDHVVAPVHSAEAYLRATVTNAGEHTLLPGPAAVFHEAEFTGSTRLDTWAPGEEVELALGVDDRIHVERELTRRTAGKAALGSSRRREVAYRYTVTNHSPRQATVTLLDQVPVARHPEITVRDVDATPQPAEITELGEVRWRFELAPGASAEASLAFRVDTAKSVELTGWRE